MIGCRQLVQIDGAQGEKCDRMDDQGLDRGRRLLGRVIGIVEQVARKQ